MALLKRPLRATAAALLLAGALCASQRALAAPTATQVEAVFLFYFSEFVAWPRGAFGSPQAPIVICVLGNDPFDGALDQAVAGERVDGRTIVVRRMRNPDRAGHCHILYIGASEAARLPEILRSLRGRSVLTVSGIQGFARQGGIVRFVLVDAHVRLRINMEAARAGGLTLSSKLLSAAQLIGPAAG